MQPRESRGIQRESRKMSSQIPSETVARVGRNALFSARESRESRKKNSYKKKIFKKKFFSFFDFYFAGDFFSQIPQIPQIPKCLKPLREQDERGNLGLHFSRFPLDSVQIPTQENHLLGYSLKCLKPLREQDETHYAIFLICYV